VERNASADGPLPASLREATAASGLPIVAAYLFGSTARGQAAASSDVDVAVLFDDSLEPPHLVAAAARLHSLLERVSPRPVQVVVLNEGSPLLRHQVLRDGVVLMGEDDPRRVRFESAALCEYLDVLPMIERATMGRPNPRAPEGRPSWRLTPR
jgi:predicted nucleotidyltransferase